MLSDLLMMNNLSPFARVVRNAEGAGGTAGGGEAEAPASGAGVTAPGTPPSGGGAPAQQTLLNGGGEGGEAAPTTEGAAPPSPAGEATAEASFSLEGLSLPEGLEIPEELGTAFTEALNSPDLSPQERGQRLLDLYANSAEQMREAGEAAATEAWMNLNEEWRTATRALPEFASNFEGELGAIKQALVAAGAGDEFFSVLDLTGVGNNPHVLSVLHKLTQPLREGAAVGGGASTPRPRDHASVMFPSMQPKG